jgi:predicted dehydrogenase
MSNPHRRNFLKQAGWGAAAATLLRSHTSASAYAANDRIVAGVIGPGGMGSSHVKNLLNRDDVEIAWICDVDAQRVSSAAKLVKTAKGRDPKTSRDLREVLDDKSVDAVWIATPDHWHAPATILACDAGKHVYVEKPCAHNIREGRLMVEAARRNKRVVQVGTQSRSTEHIIEAMKLLREGVIGDVLVAKAWNSQLRANLGKQQPSDPPAHLDFDLWLGPAPLRRYQSNLLHASWRWWYDFGVGDIGNDGVHDIDIARWGLGVDTHPTRIAALGGKYFFDDDQQWPDTQYCIFEYPSANGSLGARQLIFEQRIWSPYVQETHENGNAFYGTKGMMVLGKKDGWKVTLAGNKPGPSMSGTFSLPAHHQNFIECIRTGKEPHADIQIGHTTATLCHLGNIATRVGRAIRFDAVREEVLDDPDAAKFVRRTYRPGHWAVPKGV